jgi:syntaxin 16
MEQEERRVCSESSTFGIYISFAPHIHSTRFITRITHSLYAQMATRSRTNLFLSYRDSAIRPSSSSTFGTPYLNSYSSYAQDEDSAENARLISDGLDEGDWSRRGSAWSTVSSSSNSKGKRRANDALPPKWVDLADQVDALVERVKPKSKSCSFLSRK